jgi:hypothetical protein
MKPYTVVWDPELDRAFMDAWIDSDSRMRATLTAVSNWLDVQLGEDPDKKGRSRSSDAARIIEVPLSVSSVRVEAIYHILPDDRLVRLDRLIFHDDQPA